MTVHRDQVVTFINSGLFMFIVETGAYNNYVDRNRTQNYRASPFDSLQKEKLRLIAKRPSINGVVRQTVWH